MFIINNGNLAVDIPLGGSSCPLFPGGIGIWNLSFCGRRKTRVQTATNSTHM